MSGGTAFPIEGSPGMTLRDYFAAAAMQAYLSRELPTEMIAAHKLTSSDYAALFYDWADAMIEERAKSAPIPPRFEQVKS